MSDLPTPSSPGTRIEGMSTESCHLDRALGFYCGVLGFEVMQHYGDQAAFISAGGYHHHIGLNTWEAGRPSPAPGTAGLFHTAILYPTRAALADAASCAGGHQPTAPAITASGALYLRDPTRMASRCTVTGPRPEWPRKPDGSLAMFTRRVWMI